MRGCPDTDIDPLSHLLLGLVAFPVFDMSYMFSRALVPAALFSRAWH